MKDNQTRTLNKHGMGMLVLLIVQYVLGTLANLFVQFPENASVGQNWEFMRGQWLIWAHVIVGTLIVLGVLALYVRAIKMKDKVWKISGGIASGSVILAFISGEEFVSKPQALLSLTMSLLFIVALLSISWGVYKTKERAS
jgi:hypothetical protein